jgi:hypothetical protein
MPSIFYALSGCGTSNFYATLGFAAGSPLTSSGAGVRFVSSGGSLTDFSECFVMVIDS